MPMLSVPCACLLKGRGLFLLACNLMVLRLTIRRLGDMERLHTSTSIPLFLSLRSVHVMHIRSPITQTCNC